MPAGILCLGIPTTIFSTAKLREKLRQSARRHESGMTSLARSSVNWIDLLRAGMGAWIIQKVLPTSSAGQDDLALTFLVAQVAIFTFAVVAQTIWIQRPICVIGPLFFLSGLAFILCGPIVAGFALALSLGCALMLRRLSLAFLFVPASLLIFAALFGRIGIMTIVTAGAFALPAFLSFAFHTRIAFARRPITVSHSALRPAPMDSEAEAGIVITPDFTAARIEVANESLA